MWAGSIPATLIAGLLFVSTSCAAITARQTSSPEASASAPVATPAETPTSGTTPPPASPPTVVPPPSSVTAPLAKLIITSVAFHAAEVGIAYAPVSLGAMGGKPPYTWTANSGTLPTGLALSSDGKVTGTPSVAGAFSFVVRVDDAAGGAAGVPRSLTVARHLAVSGSCATQTCSVEQGCVTVCGGYGSQGGGVGPFKYAVTAGGLPPSTSLNGLSLAGTFTVVSKYFFMVKVTDSLGAVGSVSANFNVFPHIRFGVKLGTCGPSYGCTVQLPYTMGTPGGTPKLTFTKVACPNTICTGIAPEPPPNTLPKVGFQASALRGFVTITFGLPGASTYGDWVGYTNVTITDQSLCGLGPTLCSATVRVNVDTETKYG
jgi:hypothetical protein